MAVQAYEQRGRLFFASGEVAVGAADTDVGSIVLPRGGYRRAVLDVLNTGAQPLTDFVLWVRGHPDTDRQRILGDTAWLTPTSGVMPFVTSTAPHNLPAGARAQAWLLIGAFSEIGFIARAAAGSTVRVLLLAD